jgi:hypothetical protein
MMKTFRRDRKATVDDRYGVRKCFQSSGLCNSECQCVFEFDRRHHQQLRWTPELRQPVKPLFAVR